MFRKSEDQRLECFRPDETGHHRQRVFHLLEANELYHGRLCARIELEQGAGIDFHPHEGEQEIYIVTRGQIEMDDNGCKTVAEPGDVLLTNDGESHSAHNRRAELAEMIAIILPKESPC